MEYKSSNPTCNSSIGDIAKIALKLAEPACLSHQFGVGFRYELGTIIGDRRRLRTSRVRGIGGLQLNFNATFRATVCGAYRFQVLLHRHDRCHLEKLPGTGQAVMLRTRCVQCAQMHMRPSRMDQSTWVRSPVPQQLLEWVSGRSFSRAPDLY